MPSREHIAPTIYLRLAVGQLVEAIWFAGSSTYVEGDANRQWGVGSDRHLHMAQGARGFRLRLSVERQWMPL
jgi:hypothetical protein